MAWTAGDVSSSQTLTSNDHLYSSHVNELRTAVDARRIATTIAATGGSADSVCDGTADHVEINAALLSAVHVYIRAGTYSISSNLNLQNGNRLVCEPGVIFQLTSGKTVKVSGKSDVIIDNLCINGSSQAVNNFGLYIEDSSKVRVQGGKFDQMTGFGVFITSTSTNTCKDITLDGMYLYGLGNNDVIGGGPGNTTSFVDNITVTNCHVYQDCTTNNYENGFDIVRVKGVKCIGNHFYGKVQFGTEQYPNIESEFIGNTVRPAINKSSTSVLVTTYASASSNNANIVINSNNIISGQIKCSGISGQLIKQLVIVGNSVKCVNTANGIDLQYVTNATVIGNSISNAAAGVYFDNSSNSIVQGNQIDSCVNAVKDNAAVSTIKIGQNSYSNISSTPYIGGSQQIDLPKQTTTNADGLAIGGDTYLYRNASSSMKTDGKFIVGSQMGVVTNSPNSSFHVNGSFSTAVTTKSAGFTPSISEHTFLVDATSGAVTATLPTSSGLTGRQYVFIKTDSSGNSVTVDGFGSETINGSLTYVLGAQYKRVTVVSDGTNWYVGDNN